MFMWSHLEHNTRALASQLNMVWSCQCHCLCITYAPSTETVVCFLVAWPERQLQTRPLPTLAFRLPIAPATVSYLLPAHACSHVPSNTCNYKAAIE
jgi:hypothetical protein